MKTLVLIFHPQLAQSKVNQRWAQALKELPSVTVRKLYDEYPNWTIDVEREQALLIAHERVVFQHPFWWYSAPPLMKKWFDDVLTYGWAYGPGGTALHGKEWVSAISTGGPQESYQSGGYNNYAMSELLKPLQQTANLIGMKFLPPFVLHGVVQASDEQIAASAEAYARYVSDPDLDPQVRLKRLLQKMENAGTTLSP